MFKRDPGLGLSLVPSSEGGAKTDGKIEIPVTLQIQFVIQPIYFHFFPKKILALARNLFQKSYE